MSFRFHPKVKLTFVGPFEAKKNNHMMFQKSKKIFKRDENKIIWHWLLAMEKKRTQSLLVKQECNICISFFPVGITFSIRDKNIWNV